MSASNGSNKALFTGFLAGASAAGSLWWLVAQAKKKQPPQSSSSSSTDSLIYMDYNGTTPVYPDVLDAMLPYFQQHYGNPNSSHAAGDAPRAAMEAARRQILTHLLGVPSGRLAPAATPTSSTPPCSSATTATVPSSACIFTACGTEADNLAIHLALMSAAATRPTKQNGGPPRPQQQPPPHVVTCNVEHAAIDGCLAVHEAAGRCTVTRVPVQPDGRVTAPDVIAALQPNT